MKRSKRFLSAEEKYEVFLLVLTKAATQRAVAEKFGVDRTTVIRICRVAQNGALMALAASVPGRPARKNTR